jgi:hypothetical protein
VEAAQLRHVCLAGRTERVANRVEYPVCNALLAGGPCSGKSFTVNRVLDHDELTQSASVGDRAIGLPTSYEAPLVADPLPGAACGLYEQRISGK